MAIDFVKIYREWSEERLIAALENAKDYEPEAVKAMKDVLMEMKGEDFVSRVVSEISEQEKKTEIQAKKKYEKRNLNTDLSDEKYAASMKDSTGLYFDIPITTGSVEVYSAILIVLGITGYITVGVSYATDFLESSTIWLTFLVSSLLMYLGVRIIQKNKLSIKLIERNRDVFLEVKEKDKVISYKFPFKYVFYGELNVHRQGLITIKTPELYFIFENDENGQLMINEKLSALRKIPYGWPRRKEIGMEIKAKKRYAGYGTTPINLEKIKKILDGLSSQYKVD